MPPPTTCSHPAGLSFPCPGARGSLLLPRGEGWRPVLLAGGVHVADSKVLGDLLHILKVKECIETGFICKSKTLVRHKLSVSPQFSSTQSIPHHRINM